MHKAKVVIVGAGAAGVAATARLMESGMEDIVVLEAEDRIGGRIHTILFGDKVVDLGAQWVHGEVDNVVYAMAKEHDLLTASSTEMLETVYIESNGKLVNEEVSDKIIGILSLINKAGDTLLKDFKGSLGDYYTKVFRIKMNEEFGSEHESLGKCFLDWFEKFENSIDGSDSWFETSGRGLTEYWECEGNLLLSWKSGGYRKIFDLLMNKYPYDKEEVRVPDKVKFNKEVTHIKWNNVAGHDFNKAVVECSDGTSYIADHVIVTTSLGVLKQNAHSMFLPALPPKKLNAIKGLAIGTVDKIFVKFPYRWWPEKYSGFSLLWSDEDARSFKSSGNTGEGLNGKHWMQDVFGFYYVDNHPLVLCGWIVGPSARYMEQLSDEQVLEGCHELLQKFAGRSFNITVPRPERIVRSRWSANPHFRGSYSFRSMESEELGAFASHLAEPLVDRSGKPVLLFGGEATHDHYYSTVHGAVETGWREADRILRYYGCEIPRTPGWSHLKTCKVVIVGAGIAGLAVAKTLLDDGFQDFVILEAQDRAGGRIYSVPLNEGWIETGAQWIHGQKNEVWKLGHRYNLLSNITSSEGEGPYLRDDGVEFEPALVKEIQKVVDEILEECEQYAEENCIKEFPTSIGHHLKEKFEQYLDSCQDSEERRKMKEELYDWHVRFQVIDNSCTGLDKLSAKAWGTYFFSGGKDYVNFNEGYSSLVKSIVNELPAGALNLNSPVNVVKWQEELHVKINHEMDSIIETRKKEINGINGYHESGFNESDVIFEKIRNKDSRSWEIPPVVVICDDGTFYAADHVVVTCSLGCLKEKYRTMFEPQLPDSIIQAIEDLGFATINKIFLAFDKPWWNPDTKGFQLIWSKDNYIFPSREEKSSWTRDLTGFDVVYGQEGVLVGWVGGKGAELMEELTEEEIGQHCTQLLRQFTRNRNIPLPVRVIRSQWQKNEYIRGGYSHSTNLCDMSGSGPSDLLNPVWSQVYCNSVPSQLKHPVVMLAGEAAHEHYFSTTHGAYETGRKQARVILDYLNSLSDTSSKQILPAVTVLPTLEMGIYKCVSPGCRNTSADKSKSFFAFPREPARCGIMGYTMYYMILCNKCLTELQQPTDTKNNT